MKHKFVFLLISFLLIVFALSCKKFIFREITCRDFIEDEELKWMTGNKGDSLKFHSTNGKKLSLIVSQKNIFHRNKYKSDTGCGCVDYWEIIYTNGKDSMIMAFDSRYIEKNESKKVEDVWLVINGERAHYNETLKVMMSNYTVDSTLFSEVKTFSYPFTKPEEIKSICIVKNYGIVKFEKVNGEVWYNDNLKNFISVDKNSFLFTETSCN